ncbi:MAG: hypothetical protein AAGN35_23510 [Bacteroidota bacterium]
MAKKNVIQVEFDSPASVLGVASNDKIWKVCWNINQQLGIQLATAPEDVTRVKGPAMYTDLERDPDFDYYFFENTHKTSKVPRLARQFRYWLVIRHRREVAPEIRTILRRLAQVDNISLAHDLSHEKDIKKLLP